MFVLVVLSRSVPDMEILAEWHHLRLKSGFAVADWEFRAHYDINYARFSGANSTEDSPTFEPSLSGWAKVHFLDSVDEILHVFSPQLFVFLVVFHFFTDFSCLFKILL